MRALLIKDWGGYRAGQVLTAYPPEAIPADHAAWYGDDEIVPMLRVVNSEIDPHSPELAGRIGVVPGKPTVATPPAKPKRT